MSEETREYHKCVCQSCEDGFEASWDKFMQHCREKHGVTENEKGTREMLMHIDGHDFYEWRHRCKFGNKVEFIEYHRQLRRGKDKQMWR